MTEYLEPWWIDNPSGTRIANDDNRIVGNILDREDAERIVLCVNFLAGISDDLLQQMAKSDWTLREFLKHEIEDLDKDDDVGDYSQILSKQMIALAGGVDNLDIYREGWYRDEAGKWVRDDE